MLKSILFLLLFSNLLFADLVDIYRTKGIEAVKLELEKELKKKSYWDNYLKNKDIKHGYYESIKYIIVCDKGDKKLVFIEVQTGSYFGEDDIIRIEDDYNRVK